MHNHSRTADVDLVALAKAGESTAFTELVQRHTPAVRAVAIRIMRNEVDADDMVQDTFMNAWRSLHLFSGTAPFGAWLRSIARNCCLMRLRSRRRRPTQPLERHTVRGEPIELNLVAPGPSPEQQAQRRELMEHIHSAIAALPPPAQDILHLADFEHLNMKQLSTRLDLSLPAVKSRLHRARLGVRAGLAGYLQVNDKVA